MPYGYGRNKREDTMNAPAFPSFYAECAFHDGRRDALAGHSDSRAAFMRHGDPEPTGMRWYEAGRVAAVGA
jgi:hypothetical protein